MPCDYDLWPSLVTCDYNYAYDYDSTYDSDYDHDHDHDHNHDLKMFRYDVTH